MKCDFLKTVDEKVIFTGKYMEIYIPRKNFESDPTKKGISEYSGEYLETLGNFNFLVFPEGKENRDNFVMRSLNLAVRIKIEYSNTYKITTQLPSDLNPVDYTVFCLEKDDLFCVNLFQEKSAENTKDILTLIHSGNLPKAGSYEKQLAVYSGATLLNGTKLNSPLVIFELILAEINRWEKDPTVPFRKAITDPSLNVSEYDYLPVNLKQLPTLNSTFSAMTFEDIHQSTINSIKKTKYGEEEKESSIEKMIKY